MGKYHYIIEGLIGAFTLIAIAVLIAMVVFH
jgi:hypothetical protein